MSKPESNMGEEETRSPQPRRGLSVLLIASIIIVFLSLSIGGFMFIQNSKGKGAVLTNGTQTPTPSATDIYLETPPPQAVFYDTFKNNALGWDLSDTTGYVRTLQNRKLTLTNTNPNTTLIESLPTNTTFDNFVVSIDLTVIKAGRNDSAGFYVRGDNYMDHDYRIDINGDNTFDLAKEYLDSKNNPHSIFLAGPRSSPALDSAGVQNTIKLTMAGPQLALFINNVEVSSIIDGDYSTGQIALFARAGQESRGVAVSFSRVEVDQPPEK